MKPSERRANEFVGGGSQPFAARLAKLIHAHGRAQVKAFARRVAAKLRGRGVELIDRHNGMWAAAVIENAARPPRRCRKAGCGALVGARSKDASGRVGEHCTAGHSVVVNGRKR